MKLCRLKSSLVAVAALALPVLMVTATPSTAGDPCEALWYQRNKIYANAGYCFKTAKGIAVFGKGCFPPYGKLSSGQQKKINWIKKQEAKHDCN